MRTGHSSIGWDDFLHEVFQGHSLLGMSACSSPPLLGVQIACKLSLTQAQVSPLSQLVVRNSP